MSPRRTILRELYRRHQAGTDVYVRAGAIAGFETNRSRYQQAVNELLSQRLINGTKDGEGRLAVAVNGERLEAVRRELRPWFLRPVVQLTALVGIAVIALFWLMNAG